jgi:hypothetical protein
MPLYAASRWAIVLAVALAASEIVAAERGDIDAAIQRGVKYLKATQNADGTWQDDYGTRLGGIALAGLALCEGIGTADDDSVEKAANLVRNFTAGHRPITAPGASGEKGAGGSRTAGRRPIKPPPQGRRGAAVVTPSAPPGFPTQLAVEYRTYDLALAIMLLDKLTRTDDGRQVIAASKGAPEKRKKLKSGRIVVGEQVDDSRLIVGIGQQLLRGQGARGTWTYTCQSQTSLDGDHSNTQFAVLGVWLASQHGLDAAESLRRCSDHFRSCQNEDGSWNYTPAGMNTGPSMTCAGLAALAVGLGVETELVANRGDSDAPREREARKPDQQVAAGLKRLETYLLSSAATNDFYFFWSLERVGVLYGTDAIGKVLWYPWGTERVLQAQQADGSWPAGSGVGTRSPLVSTSFAILFLKRANISPELSRALANRFGSASALEGHRPGSDAQKALKDMSRRAGQGSESGGAAGDDQPGTSPPDGKQQESVGRLLEKLARVVGRSERRAAVAELDTRSPTYAEVKDYMDVLVRLATGEEAELAAVARRQLVNAFQRAPMSQCLYWLGEVDEQLRALIWNEVDGRISRADEARIEQYRKAAGYLLGEQSYKLESRKAAIDLLSRLKGDASVAALSDPLSDMPRTLWPRAGEALKQLTGEDFGPREGDGIAEVLEAQKRWRAWLKRPQSR